MKVEHYYKPDSKTLREEPQVFTRWIDPTIEQLQQENKQLKEQLEYLRSNEYLNQVKWERNFNEELVKDLQQKIDNAIEYIKECEYHLVIQPQKLLEILGDKE